MFARLLINGLKVLGVALVSVCAASLVAAPPSAPPPTPPPVKDARDAAIEAREKARDAKRDMREAIRDANREARDVRREARRLTREQLGIDFGRLTQQGLAIASVATDGLLGKAGLRANDIVASVNGQPVKSAADFDRQIYAGDPAKDVEVTIVRDGKEEVLPLPSGSLYDDSTASDLSYFGVTLDSQYPNRIVIRTVRADSPASLAGLRAGDEITTWHSKRISPRDFASALRDAKPGIVEFEYVRDSKTYRSQARFERPNGPGFPEK